MHLEAPLAGAVPPFALSPRRLEIVPLIRRLLQQQVVELQVGDAQLFEHLGHEERRVQTHLLIQPGCISTRPSSNYIIIATELVRLQGDVVLVALGVADILRLDADIADIFFHQS